MRKAIILVGLVILVGVGGVLQAQEAYFGKNKVRYKGFEWHYIQTRHFDIYFYEDAYETATFGADVLESAYQEISRELNYVIQRRVPVFIYNSHNDFQQTNILPSLIGEGTGGFTEVFKNRVVTPFNGSYEDFRHVLHHELTHAFTFDMLYGGAFSSVVSKQRLFAMPLWLAEGYAEYSSRHGWDYFSDMWVRDATINGYLAPMEYLNGYNAYREGQALIKFIVDEYGEEKISQLFKKGKIYLSMKKTLKRVLGIDEEQLWKDFSKEMKRRYWPEIAVRKEIEDFGRKLTDARKDGSYMNEKPTFSPEGDKIAMFTDRSDYTEIVLISADDGKLVDHLVKASRSGDMESLHSYVSGLSFSPSGDEIVFVAKSNGKETLFFYDLYRHKTVRKRTFDFYNVLSPAWSPDGQQVAFSALSGNQRDLFLYDLTTDQVRQLTNDRYDDIDPAWHPDGGSLVFTSDRSFADKPVDSPEGNPYVIAADAYRPGDFDYGNYGLFTISVDKAEIHNIDVGPGGNSLATYSPDGEKLAFVSNRNGIDNVYIALLDEDRVFAITNVLTGIHWIDWAPDGKSLVVQAFNKGLYDVFIVEDLTPVGDDGVLTPTAFFSGEYDRPGSTVAGRGQDSLAGDDTTGVDTAQAMADGSDIALQEDVTATGESTAEIDTTLAANATDTAAAAAIAETPETLSSIDDTTSMGPEPVMVESPDTPAVADSVTSDSPASTPKDQPDSTEGEAAVVDSTGIYDDEFVFVDDSSDRFESFMEDVGDDSLDLLSNEPAPEPASFDSIPLPPEGGEYEIHDYRVKFTPDYIGGGFAYDTFFGLRGQTVFMFSDYLGNHSIVLATDLVNTIDQSNIQAYYFNSTRRTSYGVGLLHSKNFYLDNSDFLFSDRFYGAQLFARRPFSTFSRLELVASQFFIDREYYDRPFDTRPNRSSKVTTGSFSYVVDNIIWGLTGPVNGRRAKVIFSGGINLFDATDVDYFSAEFDYRKYWRLNKSYSVALRLSGGASGGRTPKRYFLGGPTNWIGNRTLDAEVYDVENLYFADVVTPLRGIEYYSLSGNRYGLINFEFRYPMIDYLAMRFPLPLVLSRVGGALFFDMGAAWDEDDFKGGTTADGRKRLLDIKTGFGFGMRANLGFILLRYDMAWNTDFYNVADKPSYYFSIGADF
ncbi:MAG: BamA/TamA family outer membrane protein [bacterium]